METRVPTKRWRIMLALHLLLIAAFAGIGSSATAQGIATIQTDYDDYPPGETVYITGSGFLPGEDVILQVVHVGPNPSGTDPIHHQPWTVIADPDGNVSSFWVVPLEGSFGETFLLTADGQMSALHAEKIFTDGDGTGTMTVSPTTVCGNILNNYLFTFRTTGNAQGVYGGGSQATVLVPNGWTAPQFSASGSPGYVSVSAVNSAAITSPLTISSGPLGWTISFNFTCSSGTGNGFNLNYTNATAPLTAGNYEFSTFTKSGTGGSLKAVTPSNLHTVTVNALPAAPTGGNSSVCATGSVTFSAAPVGSGQTIDWFDALTGGNQVATGTNNYTTSISGTTTYYAQSRFTSATGCTSSSRTAVTITVNPAAMGGAVTGSTTVCSGSNSGTLTLSGHSGTIVRWEASTDNFVSNISPINNPTTSQPYANLLQTTSFRAVIQNGTCAAAFSLAATITVSGPTASITGSTTICNGDNVPLTIAVTGTGPWSGTLSNGQAFSGSSSLIVVPVNPSATTTYTVATLNDASCSAVPTGLTGSAVITVRPTLTATISTAALTVCPGQTKIDFTGTPSTIVTYNDGVSDQTIEIKNNGTATINPTLSPGVYTYTLVKVSYPNAPSCETLLGSAVEITVNQPPSITSQPSSVTTTYGNGGISFTSSATGTGINYQWQVNTGGGFVNVTDNATYSGATTNVLNVNNPTASMNGFTYQLRVTGVCTPPATSNTVTLTVNKAELTVKADDKSKVYGAVDPALTYTPSGTLFYGDGYGVITGVTLSTATGAAATFGTHVITATGGIAANYNVTHINGTLTVAKAAALTVTADNKSKVYGADDPALTYSATGTLYYTDTYSVITGVNLSTATGAAATYGTHVIIATGGVAANYEVSHVNGTLTVSKATLTVTADDKTKVYGGPDPALTYTESGDLFYGDQYSVISGVTLSTATGAAATAGTHVITAVGGVADNYTINHVNGTLTVGKASLTVTADDKTKVYGGADPTLTSTPSGTLYYGDSYSVITGVTLSTVTGAAATYGTHVIFASGGVADNYEVTHVNGTLTVSKATLTVTADNKSKVYGGAEPPLTFTPSGALFYSDGYSVISGVILNTVTGAAATAGTHPINASGGVAANYTVIHVNGTLTVGKAAALTVAADNKSKVYGAADPALTYSVTGTFYYTDNYTVITGVNLSTATGAAATFGTHVITAVGGTAANYEVNHVNGTLTVAKAAALTVTADDKSKVYGAADPALTYSVTGTFYYSDNYTVISGVALSTATGASATVGTHVITASGGAATNYNVTHVNGTLTVSKAALTITAKSRDKYCGQEVTFAGTEFTSTGLKYSDVVNTVTLTSAGAPANASTSGSPYPIVASAAVGTGLSNYNITYVDGSLTILGIVVDASVNSNPQPVKNTSTVITASISPAVAGVFVTFKVDNVVKGTSQTNALGVASFDIGVLAVEVYKIEAIAGSDCSNSIAYLPVYDPSAGFVTGGGWFISPITTLPYMQASGKANFGFVSKYLKGSNTPTGNTEFQFQAGNLNFASSSYDLGSLVVTSTKAIYKGVGKINGAGNYGFMVAALDGQATGGGGIDKFRIKIWDKSNGDAIVYDNNAGLDDNGIPTTALGGGSIVIHTPNGKGGGAREANEQVVESTPIHLDETISVDAYPNPMRSTLSIKISNPKNELVSINMMDNAGRTMVVRQPESALDNVYTIDTEQLPSGLYILRVKVGAAGQTMKLLKE